MPKVIDIKKAHRKLTKFIESEFQTFYNHEEYRAAVTHWFHNPYICPPFMQKKIF
jgi:hypothetical protein